MQNHLRLAKSGFATPHGEKNLMLADNFGRI